MNLHYRTAFHATDRPKEAITMLHSEQAQRAREQELLRESRRARLARAATAGRCWERIARYARHRAARARDRASWP